MIKKRFLSASALLYGGSLLLHVGFAVGLSLVPKAKKHEVVAIQMAEGKKKGAKKEEAPKPPDPPPPEPPKPAAAKTKAAPAPKAPAPEPATQAKAAPPTAGMENLLDMGMMGNGGSGNGMSVGARAQTGATPTPQPTATTKKLEQLAPVAERCTEPVVKPHRKGGPQPAYTAPARQAEIEGVVKVEVTVDESGRVLAARVVGSLGYGLDEAAIAAAKRWTFEPATKCGKPVIGAAHLPFRFKLGQ